MAKPYDPKDFYYRKAKKAGLRARSAFKIEEILRRHRLLGKGQAVLDLGAAPGGFLQILADVVGERGVAGSILSVMGRIAAEVEEDRQHVEAEGRSSGPSAKSP